VGAGVEAVSAAFPALGGTGFFAAHKLPPNIAQRPIAIAIFLTGIFIFPFRPAQSWFEKLSHKHIEV
jgi:predicted small integral membrane protein